MPASDFGAFTTTIFTICHLRHNSISTPIAINNIHKTSTRKPDGKTTPKRIPSAIAMEHSIYKLPLLRHIASHRPFHALCYILRKKRSHGELSALCYLSKSLPSSSVADFISEITHDAAWLSPRSTPVFLSKLRG